MDTCLYDMWVPHGKTSTGGATQTEECHYKAVCHILHTSGLQCVEHPLEILAV